MALTGDPSSASRRWGPTRLSPAASIVGRNAELSVLAEAVTAVRRQGAAFLVVGEPGVGVSALLRVAGDQAATANCTILTSAGNEAESDLPFAALHRLLQPLFPHTGTLPTIQRHALQTALAMEAGGTPDPFLVALGTLNLLTGCAATQPIVAMIDNLQWLDTASSNILTFVVRRLSFIPLIVIGGLRQGYSAASYGAPFIELALARLDDAGARQLLAATGIQLVDEQRDWILTQSLGNPLALVELSAIPIAVWNALDSGTPWRWISARLERTFIGRLVDLPIMTRDALLIAAIGDTGALAEILAATSIFSGRVVTAAVLEPAERMHLLQFDEVLIEFRHSLVRSAIAIRESVVRRQAAHAAWAAALGEPASLISDVGAGSDSVRASAVSDQKRFTRRTWHRARAAAGPDVSVADDLEVVAVASVRLGLLPEALAALQKSAQLTTGSEVRARRLLMAAEHATSIGRVELADHLVSRAQHNGISGMNIIRLELLREAPMASIANNSTRVAQLCVMSEQAMAAGERDLALKVLLAAAQRCWWAPAPAQDRARVADLAQQLHSDRPDARCAVVMALSEPIQRGTQVITMLDDLDIPANGDGTDLRVLGLAAHAVGDQVRAVDLSARAEIALRRLGRVGALAHALGVGSTARLDLGDWAGATASSAEGAALAQDAGQLIGSAGAVVNQARYLALQGATSAALQCVAEVEYDPLLRTLNNFLCRAQIVRGIAWISAGRHADAYQALKRIFDPHDPSHHEREQIGGIMYLAEASIGCNERTEARRITANMENLATLTASPLLIAHLLYARPVLADDQDAEQLFLDSLCRDLVAWPWVRARIQLAFGSWLRRQRRNSDSRHPLRSAVVTFDQLGASAWAAQARGELDATGERREPPEENNLPELSAQELQITYLAAQGLSNAEIGQQLRLSPRTVASHLYRIFPKLDITSRSQIAGRLGRQPPSAHLAKT